MKKEKFPSLIPTASAPSSDIFQQTTPPPPAAANDEPPAKKKDKIEKPKPVSAADDSFIMVTMKLKKKHYQQLKFNAIATNRKIYQVLGANLEKIIDNLV